MDLFKSVFGFRTNKEPVLPLHAAGTRESGVSRENVSPHQPTHVVTPRTYPQSAKQPPRWLQQPQSSPSQNKIVAQRYVMSIRKAARREGEDEDLEVITALLGNETRAGKLNQCSNKDEAMVYWQAVRDAMLTFEPPKTVAKDMEEVRLGLVEPIRSWLQYQPHHLVA